MKASSAAVVFVAASVVWLGGCSSSSDEADSGGSFAVDAGALEYAPCSTETRVGRFSVELAARFTGVNGDVYDTVDPARVPMVARTEGECRLLRAPDSFCEPTCGSGETCGPDGCIASPRTQSVGDVTLTGLATSPLVMSPRVPGNHYTNPGSLPHPGFAPGDAIAMQAAGDAYPAFALRGLGIAAIELSGDAVVVQSGSPAVLSWTPQALAHDAVRIHVSLDIARHGGTPARIECDVPDTGAFEIPATLVTELVALGFSGFPAVDLTRRSVDSVDVEGLGCVELEVVASTRIDVEVPGLVSCSTSEDCPEGQTCSPSLTCEE